MVLGRSTGVASVRRAAVVLVLVASALVAVPALAAPPAITEPYAPGVVLVGFVPGASAAARAEALRAVGTTDSEQLSPLAVDARKVQLGGSMGVEQAIAVLSRNPNVRYAEPDYIVRASETSNDPDFLNGSLWGMYGPAPASPTNAFGSQAAAAWDGGNVGSRAVYVGIIDTGITWTHPDLSANVGNPAEIPGNSIDDDGNGVVDDTYGYDFASINWKGVGGDATPEDGNGHGTHVAGTIGAVGGNGVGVAGINWQVRMLSGKFLSSSGSGSLSNAVRAIDYFTTLKIRTGLNIVATNNSWGGGGFSQSLLDAINRGGDEGILFVAAAGNGGSDQVGDNNDSVANYPSNYRCVTGSRAWDCVIAVAALTSTGGLASWSNFGSTSVDLGAPGSGIRSTWNDGGYNTISGTSMATPHVTGAVALCASMGLAGASARRSAIITAASSTPTASLSGKTVTSGRLNVAGMITACGGSAGGTSTTYPLSVTIGGAGSGTVSGGGISCSSGQLGTCSAEASGTVILSASPAAGSTFSAASWSGCQSTSGTSCTVAMTQVRSVTANFGLASYSVKVTVSKPRYTSPTVSVSTTGGTAWTIAGCSSTCSSSLLWGTQVQFVANLLNSGTSAVTWSGCDAVSVDGKTCYVTVNGTESVTAKFAR